MFISIFTLIHSYLLAHVHRNNNYIHTNKPMTKDHESLRSFFEPSVVRILFEDI